MNLKKISFMALTLVLLLAIADMSGQEKGKAEKKGGMGTKVAMKEETIKGEVVDIACYLKSGAKGDDHQACASACANGGGHLGILTDDGKLFVSLLPDDHKNGPNSILMDHIAHKVEATGVVRNKGGIRGIMIKNVAKMKTEEKQP